MTRRVGYSLAFLAGATVALLTWACSVANGADRFSRHDELRAAIARRDARVAR